MRAPGWSYAQGMGRKRIIEIACVRKRYILHVLVGLKNGVGKLERQTSGDLSDDERIK